MQINSDYDNTKSVRANIQSKQTSIPKEKSNHDVEIKSGETVSGKITDLTRDSIKILTENGQLVQGRISNAELVKIGLFGQFSVSKFENGMPILELMSDTKQELQNYFLLDILKSFGFNANKENMQILELLIKNAFPATKENIAKLNQILKTVGIDNEEKAMFFLNNEIKPNFKYSEQLDNYISNNSIISKQIESVSKNLIELIKNENNPQIRSLLEKELSNITDYTDTNMQIKNPIKELINTYSEIEYSLKKIVSEINNNEIKNSELKENNLHSENNSEITANQSQNDNLKYIDNSEIKLNTIINANKKEILNNIFMALEKKDLNNMDIIFSGIKLDNLPDIYKLNVIDVFKNLFNSQPEIAKKITDLISLEKSIPQKLIKSLTFNFKDSKSDDFKNYINSLSKTIDSFKKIAEESSTSQAKDILKDVNNINANIEFMSLLKNNLYLQIPVNINNMQSTAELYIFKDKNQKKSNSESLSALLSLDLASLGHFEAYIQKKQNNVNCQFRIMNENIESLIKKNINTLNGLLKQKNYSLNSVTFKKITEPFTILDINSIKNTDLKNKSITNYSFDMRT